MSSLIGSLIIAAFVGYQLDEAKVKKYEMIDEHDNVVKVQFSGKSEYSCPLSCSLDHYHYAKNISNESIVEDKTWSIKSSKDSDGAVNYDINGQVMNSYTVIKTSKTPKSVPNVNLVDLND
tara:strand:+ start:284 stop:646 length:363 start_codon:yes stop_codon:yes gene_type:complete